MSDNLKVNIDKVDFDIATTKLIDEQSISSITEDEIDFDFGDLELSEDSSAIDVENDEIEIDFNIDDLDADGTIVSEESKPKNNLSDILSSIINEEEHFDYDVSGSTEGGFSEEFLKSETLLFIKDLKNTIREREGGNDLSNIKPNKNTTDVINSVINSIGKKSRSNVELYMNVIRATLDTIRNYNASLDKSILMKSFGYDIPDGKVLSYDSSVVFEFIDKGIINEIKEKSSKSSGLVDSNAYAKDRKAVNKLYKQCCNEYKIQDEEESYRLKEYNRRQFVGNPELKFYETCLEILESEENVAICTAIQFNTNSGPYYKFRCGSCGEYVDDEKELSIAYDDEEERTIVVDKDEVFNFYQILINKGDIVHLHYPRVCKNCGSINCLSSRTRKVIQENIVMSPTENSHDKTNYYQVSRAIDNRVTSGSRHKMQYGKWLDVLESKINITDNEIFEIGDKDIALDARFYVDLLDDNDNDELIERVSKQVYFDAINAFRKRNNIFQLKKAISKKSNKELYVSLALFASNSKSASMKYMYSSICSYIVSRASFKELSSLHRCKKERYDQYLTLHSFVLLKMIDEDILTSVQKNLENQYDVDFNNLDEVVRLRDEALSEYEDIKMSYEYLRDKMYNNPLVYAIQSTKIVSNAVKDVVEVFEFDGRLKKFLEDVFVQCSYVILLKDIQTSIWTTGRHVEYSGLYSKVSCIGKYRDMEHIMLDKRKIVEEYIKRVSKVYGKAVDSEFKQTLLTPYFDYVRMYHSNVFESIVKTSCPDAKLVGDVLKSKYSDNVLEYFEDKFGSDIEQYADKPIDSMRPDCSTSGYFKELFGTNLTEEMERDAKRFINVLFNEDRLNSVDILFNLMVIHRFNIFGFTGLDDESIARNISISGNLAQGYYNSCIESLELEMTDRARLNESVSRLMRHTFLHYTNDYESIEALKEFVMSSRNDNIDSIENTISNIKQEFGIMSNSDSYKAKYLDDEFYLVV